MNNKLRAMRLLKNMTQQELAESSGISRTSVSLIETGAIEPKIITVKKLAHALDINWKSLLDESDLTKF